MKATPYSRIDIDAAVAADNKVTINYRVTPTDPSYTVNEVSVLWNFAPGVDVNSSNYADRKNNNVPTGNYVWDLANDTRFKENHYKIQANNNRIYVRVAAKTNGVTNYSKVVELTVH